VGEAADGFLPNGEKDEIRRSLTAISDLYKKPENGREVFKPYLQFIGER